MTKFLQVFVDFRIKPLVTMIFCVLFYSLAVNNLHAGDNGPVDKTEATLDALKAASEYVVSPGDILFVSIWREPELTQEVLVRPDGAFSFPLAGKIATREKTVEQITEELKKKLSKFLTDAEVTVSVRQTSGYKLYVIGEVNRPGEFLLAQQVDVMQALSKAGGINAFANKDGIKILRRVSGKQKALKFNYSEVSKGKKLEQNILLERGDIIVVP